MALEKIGLQAVLEDENFQAGLKRYLEGEGKMISSTEQTSGLLSSLGSIAGGVLVAGIAAATVALSSFFLIGKQGIETSLKWGQQLDSLGDQFGFTGEKASGFTFLANKMGLSVDEMGIGLRSLINGLSGVTDRIKTGGKTLSPFEKALVKIGVSAFDSKGKLKTFDALLPELMDKFSKLPAGVNASALAMDLFGTRGGTKFLDFLRQGSKGLADAQKQAEEFGLVVSTKDVNALEEFGFEMNTLKLGIDGVWNQIGIALLPTVKELAGFITTEVIPIFSKWAKENAPKITAALKQLGDWIKTKAIPALKDLWKYLNDKIFPIFNDVVTIIRKIWEGKDVSKDITALAKKIGDELKKQWPKIEAVLSQWAKDFWDWLFASNGVISQINSNMGKLADKIKEWSESPSTKQSFQDIGKQVGQSIVDGVKGQVQSDVSGSSIVNSLISGIKRGFDIVTVPNDIGANMVGGIANAIAAQIGGQAFADKITPAMIATLKVAIGAINPAANLIVTIGNFVSQLRDAMASEVVTSSWNNLRDALGYIITTAIGNIRNYALWAYSIYQSARNLVQDIANQFINFVGVMADALYNLVTNAIYDILGIPHSPAISSAAAVVAGGNSSTFAPSYGGNSYNFNMTVNAQASAGSVVRDFGIMRSLAGA